MIYLTLGPFLEISVSLFMVFSGPVFQLKMTENFLKVNTSHVALSPTNPIVKSNNLNLIKRLALTNRKRRFRQKCASLMS
jgi:hypothetical protein